MDSWELGPLLNTYGHHTPLHHFCGPPLRGRPQNTSYGIFSGRRRGREVPPTSYVRRKPLSNVQKLFLRPYFLLIIRGMFLLRSGLRFPKAILVSESGLFLTLGSGTSSARNKNLKPLLNTSTPPISGKYGLRNHF